MRYSDVTIYYSPSHIVNTIKYNVIRTYNKNIYSTRRQSDTNEHSCTLEAQVNRGDGLKT